jgi:hypothetical protein
MSKKCEQCRKIFKEGDFCLYCGGKLIDYVPVHKQESAGAYSGPTTGSQTGNQNSHYSSFEDSGKMNSDSILVKAVMNYKKIIAMIIFITVTIFVLIITIPNNGYIDGMQGNIFALILIAIVGEWTGIKDIVKGIFLK